MPRYRAPEEMFRSGEYLLRIVEGYFLHRLIIWKPNGADVLMRNHHIRLTRPGGIEMHLLEYPNTSPLSLSALPLRSLGNVEKPDARPIGKCLEILDPRLLFGFPTECHLLCLTRFHMPLSEIKMPARIVEQEIFALVVLGLSENDGAD